LNGSCPLAHEAGARVAGAGLGHDRAAIDGKDQAATAGRAGDAVVDNTEGRHRTAQAAGEGEVTIGANAAACAGVATLPAAAVHVDAVLRDEVVGALCKVEAVGPLVAGL